MKKYKIILIITLILTFITGCYSKEERALANSYEETAKKNAINYVKKKYKIDAKVQSVNADTNMNCQRDMLFDCNIKTTGFVTVTFKYKDETFNVYISGKESTDYGTDDYQIKDIEKGFHDYFRENISSKIYDYKLKFNSRGVTEYYSNNLDEMVQYISEVELYFIDEKNLNELKTDKIEKLFVNHTKPIYFINFNSIKDCEAYRDSKYDIRFHDEIKDIYKESILTLQQGRKTFKKYDFISNYNDEVYVYSQDEYKYEVNLTSIDNLENFTEFYDDLKGKKITSVTNFYSIKVPEAKPKSRTYLYFYFPIDKVNFPNENIYFASSCSIKGRDYYDIDSYLSGEKLYTMGNYYIFENYYDIEKCDAGSTFKFGIIKTG